MNPRNTVTLIGRLGKDPEKRTTKSGLTVATFTLATKEYYKDAEGGRKEKTEWHYCKVWGKQAENCVRLLTKGQEVVVNGQLRSSEWEDGNGNRQRRTEIRVEEFTMVGSKAKAASD